MKDALGDRLKSLYEQPETTRAAAQDAPLYARIDGKNFSKFTRGFNRPFDFSFSDAMLATTRRLVLETGALLGYTQSDEISLVWHNTHEKSDHIFAGRYQKMCSVLAGIATSEFTLQGLELFADATRKNPPVFDARAFALPDLSEAANCFVWRCLDARKNSVSQLARHHFSAKQMHGKRSDQLIEMLREVGVEWDDLEPRFKLGTFIRPTAQLSDMPLEQWEAIPEKHRPASREMVRTVLVSSHLDLVAHGDKIGFLLGTPTG